MYTTRQKKNGFQPFVFLRTAWILTQCERTVCRQSNPNQKILYSVFLYSKVRQKVQIASDSPPIWILDSGFWILDSCALACRSRPQSPHLDSGFWILNSVFLRSAALLPAATQPANDIMDLIHAELLATGARIAPLTTLDEIAAFFHAAAAVRQAAPARATAIAQRLGGSLADAASMFASILPTLPSMPNVERLLSMLPPCENMSIGPNRDTCAVCEHGMLEPSEYYTTAPLLSAKGLVKQVRLFKRKCSCCHAEHHLSYATGGLRLQRGEQVPYEGCTDARYFAITGS